MRNRAVSAARKLNIWDPVFLERETDTYALLRRYVPIALTEYGSYGPNQRPGWFISRHPDVSAALGDPGLFSSSNQITPQTLIPLELDPPLHTSYRRTLNGVFSLEVVGKLEPEIRRDADELLDEMLERETFDFVEMFADPFPARVFCRLTGFPVADGPRVVEWKNTLMHGPSGQRASRPSPSRSAGSARTDIWPSALARIVASGFIWRLDLRVALESLHRHLPDYALHPVRHAGVKGVGSLSLIRA